MTKIFGALFLAASMAYAGAASADTVVYFAETDELIGATLTSPNTRDISIDYDSSLWASINSAILTVFLGDDGGDQATEFGDVAAIEGMDPGVDNKQVKGAATKDYWAIDVSNKLLPPGHSAPLTFTLKAVSGDFDYRNAKLTVNFTPVPEASTTALLGSGLLVACLALRRRVS